MKATCYLRVARTSRGFSFKASTKPGSAPIADGLRTRQIKLVLDFPNDAFSVIDAQAEIAVPEQLLAEVVSIEAREVEAS